MAVTLNASTSAGLVQSADLSGEINIQSNGTTVLGVTSTGIAVTGTQSVSGVQYIYKNVKPDSNYITITREEYNKLIQAQNNI